MIVSWPLRYEKASPGFQLSKKSKIKWFSWFFECFWRFWKSPLLDLFQVRIWPKSPFYPIFGEDLEFKRKNSKKYASRLRLPKFSKKFMQFRILLHIFTFSNSKNRWNSGGGVKCDVFVTFVVADSTLFLFFKSLHFHNSKKLCSPNRACFIPFILLLFLVKSKI